MKNPTLLKINLTNNATLHIHKDRIIATVSDAKSNRTDIYVEGISLPFHTDVIPADTLINTIWEGEPIK